MTSPNRSMRKSAFFLLVMFVAPPGVFSAPAAEELPPHITPGEAKRGSLLMRTDGGGFVAAPLLRTAVRMQVTGLINRATVRQQFSNDSDDWVEAVYVFPLPENAAVDHLRMEVGERVIEGVVKERQAAETDYANARAAGKRASLVSQERPNIFTTSLANIAPRETVSIEIEYQHLIEYTEGRFELRFPLVVGPRFIPGAPMVAEFTGSGWAANTNEVPDAGRITPQVVGPERGKINTVAIRLELNLGIELEDIESLYHPLDVKSVGTRGYDIVLAAQDIPADRDFVVRFRPSAGEEPTAALFTEEYEGYEYALLMLMPPQRRSVASVPRQVIFVIDTSGSMDGSSIRQAKQALAAALAQLDSRDQFNVIQFNSQTSSLYPQPVPVSARNRAEGRSYIDRLDAGGGTVMAPALALALAQEETGGMLRQVIFITDGNVGNEDALFELIKSSLGDSRLFTVGIGSAPNSHFMRGAARYGRGSFTHIGAVEEVRPQMDRLFRQITSPMLHDIAFDPGGVADLEVWPLRIPDLYRGEPVLIAMRAPNLPLAVTVSGELAGKRWRSEAQLHGGQGRRGVHVFWARRKIAALMDEQRGHPSDPAIRQAVIKTALSHHLTSRYTSLVAVDVTPVRPQADGLQTTAVPTNLPAGWNRAKVFGRLPGTATPARVQMLAGGLVIAIAVFLLAGFRRGRHDA